MNFLEAHKLVKSLQDGQPFEFLFAISGLPDKLDIFLKAAAAKRGYVLKYTTLPFNTLQQTIFEGSHADENTLFMLFPWDFVPALDWRSGFSEREMSQEKTLNHAQKLCDKLAQRKNSQFIYVNAPILPIFADAQSNNQVQQFLLSLARGINSILLTDDVFSMGGYLDSGSPFSGQLLGTVAETIIEHVTSIHTASCKVLITDLDNVMWHGVIGEDGAENIQFIPQGLGYKHFIYQTYLKKLKQQGVLLAVVSRNDPELALQPFREKDMVLKEEDFISVIASYNAKSSQIAELAKQLNLGLDAFVFVDDNPIENKEVAKQLPQVNCVLFPEQDDGIANLYTSLAALFSVENITEEDKQRTEMYRSRLKGIAPSDKCGSDLTDFLLDLEMELTINERSQGDRTRAVQLINKTNQFNLNGIRLSDDEVGAVLESGGRLYTAELVDCHGAHGEILACLINDKGEMVSYVMSCRVFQRRVEYAFLIWLINSNVFTDLKMKYAKTDRNEPYSKYLQHESFTDLGNGIFEINQKKFKQSFENELDLFKTNQ